MRDNDYTQCVKNVRNRTVLQNGTESTGQMMNFDNGPGVKFCVSGFRQKSRVVLESGADSGLDPLITESHGGQNGMRADTA